MATLAVHRESGTKYIVMGGGIRMFVPGLVASARPLRDPAAREAAKPLPVTMVMACDSAGTIVWFRSEELVVVEVDAATPAAILTATAGYR